MWDYLIITASNEQQAAGYRSQLHVRQQLGLLTEVREVLVVADPDGQRVGSGGSTLFCLMQVMEKHLSGRRADADTLAEVLGQLRILIIHAGGDSKRLPAYGPCGKIFVPVPGESDRGLPMTLFDRQLPIYLALPAPSPGAGQVVITSGDVMLNFDPQQVRFDVPGLTGLGCYAPPEQAANHGVYCGVDGGGKVKLFLQKPTPEQQQTLGATDYYGRSVLDIGVIHFDAATAVRLLDIFGLDQDRSGGLKLSGEMGRAVMEHGLDFYREICCALGSEATSAHHIQMVRASGSTWDDVLLGRILQGLGEVDFNLQLLRHCDFIDFGYTAQIIRSGTAMLGQDQISARRNTFLDINNDIGESGQIIGTQGWVEGCRISAPLSLGGDNVVTGVDVEEPLTVARNCCLDVIAGFEDGDSAGRGVWFVRCYGVNDTFKEAVSDDALFCGMPIGEWLESAGASTDDLWEESLPANKRTIWQARLFPATDAPTDYRGWLWMFEPANADDTQLKAWKAARRYSLEEIARLTDQDAFFRRRLSIHSERIKNSLHRIFRPGSEFSAEELAFIIECSLDRLGWIAAVISKARWHYEITQGTDSLVFPRIIHSLAAVLEKVAGEQGGLTELAGRIPAAELDWLAEVGLGLNSGVSVSQWGERARKLAFESMGKTILMAGGDKTIQPQSSLRSDEIVWGRAPARFDTGGGWTDTPPYSLEYGGSVLNTAVDLNGQAPIQAYLRVTDEPVITIGSIDLGTRIRISEMGELLDYRRPDSQYGLVKAALALAGFSNETGARREGTSLVEVLEAFGGGVEITTLAAIPKGSGLGTSSIMGAVILAVIYRAMGRELTQRELFNKVLQLEQALTTGGGWQDQVGGVVGGVKIIYTDPGLIPDPRIHFLPYDVIEPAVNDGVTLLYYTGITRLAKNILEQVVGRYLDRNRRTMATLRKIHDLTAQVADALSRKDLPAFGHLVDAAWQLNKQLDPNSSNELLEELFGRVREHVYGAKLLGAGGGGFMLMVCKSPEDARKVREDLEAQPPNERSRFFDYNVNHQGLVVTVC